MRCQSGISDSLLDRESFRSRAFRAGDGGRDRGVALVIALLLLFLMSVIGLAAVLSASSDLLINGYYSNYRGSFYAADSGLNIARQAMYNQLNTSFTTSFATFQTPPPAGINTLATTVQNSIDTSYGGSSACPVNPPNLSLKTTCYLNAGTSATSWAESFQVVPNSTVVQLATGFTNPVPGYTGTQITSYNYLYNYSIKVVGSATGVEQNTITENGSFNVYVAGTPSSYSASFAIFGAYVDNYPPCLGPLVPGTMTGTMFTNGAWGFMPGGGYIFTDPVGQHDPNASYWDSYWNCWQSPNASYTAPDGETIAPNFEGGWAVNQPVINQPANSYSQMWAAVDGKGQGEATPSPTYANLNAVMKTVAGNPYPPNGANSGVYFNYQNVNGTNTIVGGGLYVEGNAQITLSTSGASAQVISIKQGSTVTTMTVDPIANTTVVSSGGTTLNLAGVPQNTYMIPPQQGTMVYVDGTITSMQGLGEGVPGIQDYNAVTISALGDVNITGDVVYKTEPVTMTQNQIPNTPVATLIPGNDHNQDLGIFTANGNIILSSPYADGNLQVDGSQAVIGNNCAWWSCGFLVNGCINTFNNVGGQLQTNIFGACLNVENTYYDRRYTSRPGFAPPWFPSTIITNTASTTTTPPTLTVQRMSWVSSSGQ